jgi:hypothetical protein
VKPAAQVDLEERVAPFHYRQETTSRPWQFRPWAETAVLVAAEFLAVQ